MLGCGQNADERHDDAVVNVRRKKKVAHNVDHEQGKSHMKSLIAGLNKTLGLKDDKALPVGAQVFENSGSEVSPDSIHEDARA